MYDVAPKMQLCKLSPDSNMNLKGNAMTALCLQLLQCITYIQDVPSVNQTVLCIYLTAYANTVWLYPGAFPSLIGQMKQEEIGKCPTQFSQTLH